MAPSDSQAAGGNRPHAAFATTRWSVVLAAQAQPSAQAETALAELCAIYWYPLYAYVRRCGHQAAEAQDLTQAFFARLLEKQYLDAADRQRGRFRSFLLTLLKRFVANQERTARAVKRGGGHPVLSLDFEEAERRYLQEPCDHETPETIFERKWALALLDKVLRQLGDEYRGKGKGRLFERLQSFLAQPAKPADYATLAAELDSTPGAIKVAVHRLRRRYRERLAAEIAHTVAHQDEIDDEWRQLLAAVSGRL